jgi:YqjK-like protein
MSTRLREIVRKRRLLVVQATAQRGELAVQAAAVQQSLAFADLAWRGYHHLKSRPVGVAIVAAALVAIGPGKLLRVGYRGGLIAMAVLRLIKIFRSLR